MLLLFLYYFVHNAPQLGILSHSLIFAWLHHLFLEIFSSLHCPCLLNLPILICFHYAFCLFILNCHCTFTFLSLSRDAFIIKAFDKNFFLYIYIYELLEGKNHFLFICIISNMFLGTYLLPNKYLFSD